MTRRAELSTPERGWDHPWPNAFEVAAALPTKRWTLIGGLMVQVHTMLHGVSEIRPTDDLDVLLNIALFRGSTADAHAVLLALGYDLLEPSFRHGHAYRYRRVTPGVPGVHHDVVDVMAADHLGRVPAALANRPMFRVDGGNQALMRLMAVGLTSDTGRPVELTIPDELGALVLKGAAHMSDTTSERDRHLSDAAALAACIADPAAERERLRGSDGKRLRHLAANLADASDPAWLRLPEPFRTAGQDAIRILTA